MSRKLLTSLNGDRIGALHQWLSKFNGEPRIAWYPSAGEDFRDLLYLHPRYAELNPVDAAEPVCPDLFLHTDYSSSGTAHFCEGVTIHDDGRTKMVVDSIEELPRCELPLDDEIVSFPDLHHDSGRILFMKVKVDSQTVGSFSAPVIYAFVENGAFCAERVLPNDGVFSHIIHIRYGGGLGRGRASGIWLLNVLQRLNCECFVADNSRHERQPGDEKTYELYPVLAGDEDTSQLTAIRTIPSESWSGYGDVSWNIVSPG